MIAMIAMIAIIVGSACAVSPPSPPNPPRPPTDEPTPASPSAAPTKTSGASFPFAAVAVVRQQYEGAPLVIDREVVASDEGREGLLYGCRLRSETCSLDADDPRVATSYHVGQEWTIVDDRGSRAIAATKVSVDDDDEPAHLQVELGRDAPLSEWGLAFPTTGSMNPDARLIAPRPVVPTPPEIERGLRPLLAETYGPGVVPPAQHIRVYRVSTPVASHLAVVAIPDDPLNPSADEYLEPRTGLYLFKSDGSLVDTLMPTDCCNGMAEVRALVDLDGDGYQEIVWDIAPSMMRATVLTVWYRDEAYSLSI